MKKSIVSAILIVALLIAALPLAAVATDISAKTIAQEYKQLINSATLLKYAESIAFFDLDGNTIPELFLMTESTPSLAEIQIWTYKNGGTKKIGTITWGLASAGYTLYVNASGNLVSSGGPSSVDFGFWHYIDTYSFDTGGNLFAIEKVALTEQIYDIKSGTRVKLEQPLVTGTVNGQQVTEEEANRILETKNNEYRTAEVKNIFDNGFSKKSDAIIFLDGIDAFFDVPGGEYYSEPVKWAVENGITNGTGDYSFSPSLTCTRAQILTFLWRAAGSPVVSISNPFYDVSTGDYYYQAALWAYQNGMVNGAAFEGTTPCTRAATVTYIWQYAGSPASGASSFTDVPVGAAYSPAVEWAVKNRITDGVGNNQFAPNNTCTRGQIVTFLYRARGIQAGVASSSQWSEAYETFLFTNDYLNSDLFFVNNGVYFASIYDMDQDGIPELKITNGVFAGPNLDAYIYTFDGSKVKYLGTGPQDAYYNQNNKIGIYAYYGEATHFTLYQKNGYDIDAIEKTGETWPNSMVLIYKYPVSRIIDDGWGEFVKTAGYN